MTTTPKNTKPYTLSSRHGALREPAISCSIYTQLHNHSACAKTAEHVDTTNDVSNQQVVYRFYKICKQSHTCVALNAHIPTAQIHRPVYTCNLWTDQSRSLNSALGQGHMALRETGSLIFFSVVELARYWQPLEHRRLLLTGIWNHLEYTKILQIT